jgi:hypothetical protein
MSKGDNVVRVAAIPIMSEEDRATEEAMELLKAWHNTSLDEDAGDFIIARHRYGKALQRLGRLTRNNNMVKYAEQLLGLDGCDGCEDGKCENCSEGHKVIGEAVK